MSLTSDDRQYLKREIAKSQVTTAQRFDRLERILDRHFRKDSEDRKHG